MTIELCSHAIDIGVRRVLTSRLSEHNIEAKLCQPFGCIELMLTHLPEQVDGHQSPRGPTPSKPSTDDFTTH